MNNDILKEQMAYYRARSGEYDDWFYRRNRYDHSDELNREWFAEAAVVPSPDPIRLSVPKAYLLLKPGFEPSQDLRLDIIGFAGSRLGSAVVPK